MHMYLYKFKGGVRCLVESDTIIGCEYGWCGKEGIVACVWLARCRDVYS